MSGTFATLSADKQRIVRNVLNLEGRYANNPYDSGGETMWGITVATARAYGYTGVMSQMPKEVALDIYAQGFWVDNHMDAVYEISPIVSEDMFEQCVNFGQSGGWKVCQRLLNVSNNDQADWGDVPLTGRGDAATLAALTKMVARDGEEGTFNSVNKMQFVRYLDITEAKPTQENFFNGWMTRVKQI